MTFTVGTTSWGCQQNQREESLAPSKPSYRFYMCERGNVLQFKSKKKILRTQTELRGSSLSSPLPRRGTVSKGLKSSLVCRLSLRRGEGSQERKAAKVGRGNGPRAQAENPRAHTAPFWEDAELQEQRRALREVCVGGAHLLSHGRGCSFFPAEIWGLSKAT